MSVKRVLIGFFFIILVVGEVRAQRASETFGRNRVQYKQFRWNYLSSENFDVYYYDDRKRVAQEALEYLEKEFDRITDLIGFYPYQKTKVFLYNSVADLQQSNMGLNRQQFSSGGEADFVKPYVEVAHPGTLEEFKQELIYKFSDLMLNEMMFGGSLKDMFQNAVLLNLPDWFVDGASLYVAHGWDDEMDDFVRQLMRDKKANKALRMAGPEAALVGQSIWNFIVEKYGKSAINNILNYTRIIRNEERSIRITLGITFNQLIIEWKNYYGDMEKRVAQSYVSHTDSTRFSTKHRRTVVFTTVKISPDGKKIAYAENDRGKFTVKVRSLENGKETIILNGGNKVFKQTVDHNIPLLSWSDANTLGVIGVKNGTYVFWLYDLLTRSKLPRELDRFSNVRNFDFSGNGRLAVLSADLNGQNDLFLISSRRDRTRRLTNDIFDDLDPTFIPNTNTVVFSSNRTTDSVSSQVRSYDKLTSNYNLFLFSLDSTTATATRVTNTLSKDIKPKAEDENNFYYLSDQRGIVNLFKYNRITGIYSQVTNFNTDTHDYDLNLNAKVLATVASANRGQEIFVTENFNTSRQVFTPASRRREVQQAKTITERRKQEVPKNMSIKDLINSRLKEKTDTVRQEPTKPEAKEPKKDSVKTAVINTNDYTFEEPVKADTIKPVKEKPLNTNDYVFEDEAVKTKQPTETFLTRYMKARDGSRVSGPFPYMPKFSYENLVSNFVIDPLRGFSLKMDVQMNDMLENFRILGGIQTALNFRNGDVYTELQYLPYRVDYSLRFDRKVIFWNTVVPEGQEREQHKYSFQKLEVGASLPLSVRTRVSLKPFVGFTQFVDRGFSNPLDTVPTFKPSRQQFYAGAKAELVYDNSLTTDMNIIEGTRGKLSVIHYEAVGNTAKSFSQISVDVRHYQKIYREIVLAVRGFAGSFFGNSPKRYLLGGMDNWIFNTTNYSGAQNPLRSNQGTYNENILFAEFATSVRGFNYATLYGNSAMVGSIELRVPLIRALSNGPIASNFFRNLQFTAFYDIGSSWSGTAPFSSRGSVRTRMVPEDPTAGGPFKIEINEYLNPWLYSYGAGLRTMMFGYYVKFDLAWPVENYSVKDPRLSVSLGFDF
ncbi:MAG: PD40 domain-containing protein [Cyclobacteriaceae bacterium]|nr:PD40 domain-containing protein [Cyclobacteriaceae bacterium]